MTTADAVTYPYTFTGGTDGAYPQSGLTQGADGNFYGAAVEGGSNFYGSIYKLTPAGTFTSLYSFTGLADGASPLSDLVQGRDGNFYGTTEEGGEDGYGTVFSVTTNGTLNTLYSFSYTDGAYPEAGVIQGADGNFYGTTSAGGADGYGTVFSLTTNGALTTLCSFALTNGSGPSAALTLGTDGNFYGTTSSAGVGGQGTAFKITTNGILTTLLWFDGLNGANPSAPLVQATDGNFYGTTAFGATGYNPSAGGGFGTVFRLTVPVFISNSFTLTSAVACLPYLASISGKAVAPTGDTLAFAKVSGPAWLNVAANGTLSGTPTNSNIGTNIFVVSLTDSYGVSASATMQVVVIPDPPPSFINNPFSESWANLDEAYAGSIASNGTAPYLGAGDVLTFALVSGPAWLNLAANGTLSGTPEELNAGSNVFVVSVTDLGGSSNTATMSLYVNSPPIFAPQNFAKPAATVGVPYSGTIATNAADPDLSAGDTLSFYKVTGPAWLNVATNGVLSGTPSGTNLGVNSFLMLVVDSGGLSGVGTMGITVNPDQPPVFAPNPFSGPPGTAGQPYSATIATNASDPVAGDQLTFSKVSGPAWLNIAGNGSLSGLPLSANAGTNSFVVSATDLGGLTTDASMFITVTAVPVFANISPHGTNLLLSWSGGVPPYQVQVATNLVTPVWRNLGGSLTTTNFDLPLGNTSAFYRIQGN
jgi:uncharacterized repeat protein (TIGR03803 family)